MPMELVAITDAYEVDDLPIPAEYVFRLESGEEWVLCFVPTVPYEGESDDEELFGDLFARRASAIVPKTRPVARGGRLEREALDRLGEWAEAAGDSNEAREVDWLRRALERRRVRVEA